jgi:thiol-disulfide isomerase/thioredoxin
MTPLQSHQAFEDMLRPRGNRPSQYFEDVTYDKWVVVCFSAKWCGPCQRLNKRLIVEKTPGVKWYSCDVDENDVTLGYCSLKGIPGFCIIKDGVFKDKNRAQPMKTMFFPGLHRMASLFLCYKQSQSIQ